MLIPLLWALVVFPASSWAAGTITTQTGFTATVVRHRAETVDIPGLTLKMDHLPVSLVEDKKSIRTYVTIHGKFDRKGWSLSSRGEVILSAARTSDEFKYVVFLAHRNSALTLTATSADGLVQTEHFVVTSSEVRNFVIIQAGQRGDINVSIGGASLSFTQSGVGTLSSTNAMIGVEYISPKAEESRWGFLAGLRGTVAALSSTVPNRSPQVIDTLVDATYSLWPKAERFTVLLLGGATYKTMLPNGCPCGFSNLLSTEVGARAAYVISPNDTLSARTRYTPLGSSLPGALLSFSDRSLEFDFSWIRKIRGLHSGEVGLRVSDLNYSPVEGTRVALHLMTLYLGYSF